MENKALAKYQDRLATIPPPGGNGCHVDLLGIANLGIIAGLDAQTIHDNLRESIPPGKRRVSDTEINDAIRKALSDCNGNKPIPSIKKSKPKFNGPKVMEKLITKAQGYDEATIWELSPVRMDWPEEEDTIHFLEIVFLPDDLLFIGNQYDDGAIGENIRSCKDWIDFFKSGNSAGPFICINPLTGKNALSKANKLTYRGDYCISSFRHCLVEFDNIPMEEQLRFWSVAELPVKALVSSGKKSIHAWLDVSKLTEVKTFDQWQTHIKSRLYESILKPLGVDGACSNPSRLSRLPGFMRQETNKYQSLLWLSQQGKGVTK
jgi:hypothetical protein